MQMTQLRHVSPLAAQCRKERYARNLSAIRLREIALLADLAKFGRTLLDSDHSEHFTDCARV
jgi:hypothetical protein